MKETKIISTIISLVIEYNYTFLGACFEARQRTTVTDKIFVRACKRARFILQ